jgi:uncharacterized membrane protein YcaP (DUF421 family)
VLPVAAAAGFLGRQAPAHAVRVLVVFPVLLGIFRIIGKRELGRLSPFELVTLMLIPEVLSNAVQGQGPLLDALVGLSTLFLLVLVISVFSHRFERFAAITEPSPTVLMVKGRVLEEALNEERIGVDELVSEMRRQGIAEARRVQFAVLESSGNITFVTATGTRPQESDSPQAGT